MRARVPKPIGRVGSILPGQTGGVRFESCDLIRKIIDPDATLYDTAAGVLVPIRGHQQGIVSVEIGLGSPHLRIQGELVSREAEAGSAHVLT